MDLQEALVEFLEASRDERGEDPRLNDLSRKLQSLAKGLPQERLDDALVRLIGAFSAPHPQVAGLAALVCGCFVEEGADPEVLATALIPVVARAFEDSAAAREAVSLLPEVETENRRGSAVMLGDRVLAAEQVQALVNGERSSAQYLLALDHLCHPLIAALTRAPSMLKTPTVRGLTRSLGTQASQYAHFLDRLLRVPMDEEWFVIDPRAARGFALRVSGVANAFQVYALVHAALSGVRRSLVRWSVPVPRPAPPERFLAVARGDGPQALPEGYVPPFTLFRWSAVTVARKSPSFDAYREWYSNSAVPTELARFGETRVAVIGTSGIKMELGVAREFEALKAEVALLRELERRHVIELLHGFTRAPHPGHPEPGVGWP